MVRGARLWKRGDDLLGEPTFCHVNAKNKLEHIKHVLDLVGQFSPSLGSVSRHNVFVHKRSVRDGFGWWLTPLPATTNFSPCKQAFDWAPVPYSFDRTCACITTYFSSHFLKY